jgi:Cdc6-like AAA superfamily ATPase
MGKKVTVDRKMTAKIDSNTASDYCRPNCRQLEDASRALELACEMIISIIEHRGVTSLNFNQASLDMLLSTSFIKKDRLTFPVYI